MCMDPLVCISPCADGKRVVKEEGKYKCLEHASHPCGPKWHQSQSQSQGICKGWTPVSTCRATAEPQAHSWVWVSTSLWASPINTCKSRTLGLEAHHHGPCRCHLVTAQIPTLKTGLHQCPHQMHPALAPAAAPAPAPVWCLPLSPKSTPVCRPFLTVGFWPTQSSTIPGADSQLACRRRFRRLEKHPSLTYRCAVFSSFFLKRMISI